MRILERACDKARKRYHPNKSAEETDMIQGENFTNAAQTDWLLFPSLIYDNILSCTPVNSRIFLHSKMPSSI